MMRSLAVTPTWSVATVLTVFVLFSIVVERSIHRLSHWLKKTRRNPLIEAVEKMKEELMLLGFISLLIAASSRIISNICIDSKYYAGQFTPCAGAETQSSSEDEVNSSNRRGLLMGILHVRVPRRTLAEAEHSHNTCGEGFEPFVPYEGLEQLHRFIFVMAITHVAYSCLTMLLAILKVHTWKKWEEEARRDRRDGLAEVSRALTMQRQSTFIKYHTSNPWSRNRFLIWVTCFFRQFGCSVARADYLSLRTGFIMNHNLLPKYDFHGYMIRSMEEEFHMIVGVSLPLWGFVVLFMLLNVRGLNLYFWIAIIPIGLVLLMGAKLQHVIATLALESVNRDEYRCEAKIKPRDELFWFNKPELLLSLIHFILFQNSFELATFFWYWWQFGYDSCFISEHWMVYTRLALGFVGQFLCSYSTLSLYALVTQMGTRYKAALIPRRIRESIHGWSKDAKRRRKKKYRRLMDDATTVRTETSTVCSLDADDHLLDELGNHNFAEIHINMPNDAATTTTTTTTTTTCSSEDEDHVEGTSNVASVMPLLETVSVPSSPPGSRFDSSAVCRSFSMPVWRG